MHLDEFSASNLTELACTSWHQRPALMVISMNNQQTITIYLIQDASSAQEAAVITSVRPADLRAPTPKEADTEWGSSKHMPRFVFQGLITPEALIAPSTLRELCPVFIGVTNESW